MMAMMIMMMMSAQASLTLGDSMDGARQAFAETTAVLRDGGPLGAVDEWFIDDGQAFVKPQLADRWLRAVDNALHSTGAVRGVGDECKSVARLLYSEGITSKYVSAKRWLAP